jgi:transposase
MRAVIDGRRIHKDSITVAYAAGFGEVELFGKIRSTDAEVDRMSKRMQSKARRVFMVYEAGPCGYGLCRRLVAKGLECMVCAPSLIPRKPGEHVKTDRRDAMKLVRSLRAGDLSAVHVPTVEDESFRDLARAWSAAREDLKQARQRLKSFLLTHGVHYLVRPRFYPVVLALQAMRGIQFTSAIGLVFELGDLSHFAHPRQLMAWIGVTPSEHSSGSKRRQGSITKTGNSYARKLLIESAWSYRHSARVSIDIQRRHEGIPKPILDRAWEAQLRLCRRYRRLVAKGKSPNVAIVAVARSASYGILGARGSSWRFHARR